MHRVSKRSFYRAMHFSAKRGIAIACRPVADPEGGAGGHGGAMAPPKPLAIFLILRISH